MAKPGGQPVSGIILHRPLLGGRAQGFGDPLGRPLIIGGEGDADMAIVEDGVVLAIGFGNMVERLRDQEGADVLARFSDRTGISHPQFP